MPNIINIPSRWEKDLGNPIDLTSLHNLEIPEREWGIEGLFYLPEVTHVTSNTGCGKSLNVMLMCIALATGKPFARYRVPKPRRVLYLDGEMHPKEFQMRIQRCTWMTDKDFEKCIKNFKYWNGLYGENFPDLSKPDTFEWLFEYLQSNEIEVLVVDNYFCMTRMKDYNSPQEVQALEDNFVKQVKAMGIAIIFVDHLAKSGTEYGTVTKLGFTENAVRISYDKEAKMYSLINKKARSLGSDIDDLVYRISPEDNSITVLDYELAKDPKEAKAIEKNRVGNEFKKIYKQGDIKSAKLKEAIDVYKEKYEISELHYTYQSLRTFINEWVADIGYVDDGVDYQ